MFNIPVETHAETVLATQDAKLPCSLSSLQSFDRFERKLHVQSPHPRLAGLTRPDASFNYGSAVAAQPDDNHVKAIERVPFVFSPRHLPSFALVDVLLKNTFSRTSSGAFPCKLHPYPLATYISTPAINGFSIRRDGYESHRAEAVEIATNSTSHGSQPLTGWWFPSMSCSPRCREPRRLLPTIPTNPHPLV